MRLRPCGDWLLVRVEPEEEPTGLIIRTSETPVIVAEVVAVGPGKINKKGLRIPPDVSVGEIVTFLRWHLEHQQGQQLRPRLEDVGANLGLIKPDDILVVIKPGEKVKVEHDPGRR